MTEPGISFLCSAYRTEDTVVATIESVLAQTRTDWELVVVDNGPSDAMAAIVEPFTADPRIRLIRQDNARAAGGVNAAGRVATGRYVAILHSDDLVLPTFVERLVSRLDADPATAALSPDAYFLTEHGVRRHTLRAPVPQQYRTGDPVGLRELIEGWLPYYTAPVRREAWEAVGGMRLDAPNTEDLCLWLDLITHGYVVRCVDEPLTAYRFDENSDSRSAHGTEVTQTSWERVMSEVVGEHGNAGDRAALQEALVASRHRRATVRARRMLLEGDFPGARQAALEAKQERADLRTRAMAVALSVAPGLLLAVYRARKALERQLHARSRRQSLEAVSTDRA